MLTENNQSAIVDRLMQIVTATSATVQTKNESVEDELTADKNSLTAAKSLGGAHLKFLKNNDDPGGVMLTVQNQNAIFDRLIQIISKQTVKVWTKNGPVEDEVVADKNSIAAAKFIIGIQAKYRKYENEDADIVMLNAHDQKAIVERLMQILNKTFVIRQTKHGPFEDQAIADQNAIRAASVLVSIEGCSREGPGTAGSCASHDGFRIGEISARCEPENAGSAGLPSSDASESLGAGDGLPLNDRAQSRSSFEKEIPSPQPSPDHRSGGAHAGARGRSEIAQGHLDESFACCEPELAPSEPGFTAEDVVREALKIVLRDRPDLADTIDKDALIARVRAKLDCAARVSSELKVESRQCAANNLSNIA